jgi:hypothetical protein
MTKTVKISLPQKVAESLQGIINLLVAAEYTTDADKLLMATLKKFEARLYKLLYKVKKEYNLTLQPDEAIALRMLYIQFVKEYTSQVGAALLTISNQVHQAYV